MDNIKTTLLPIVLAVASAVSFQAQADTASVEAKILNGQPASQLAEGLLLPWQAAMITVPLYSEDGSSSQVLSGCGAVVISDRLLVTAAHCIDPMMSTTVVAGTEQLPNSVGAADQIDSKYKFTVIGGWVHPSYDPSINYDHDVAVLQVDRSMASVAKPIKIATPAEQAVANAQFANTWNATGWSEANLIASGWGRTEPDYNQPDELMVVTLGGIPAEQCDTSYPFSSDSHFVCADSNDPAVKKDVCAGDSGGPLIWQNPERAGDSDFGLRVVGVTSNGAYCDLKNSGHPDAQLNGLYTELASYYADIEVVTGVDFDLEPTPEFAVNPFEKISEGQSKLTPKSSGSSGGSMPLSVLAGLGLLGFLRRQRR